MGAPGLVPFLTRAAGMAAEAVPPADLIERAELAEAAETAGAAILRFASWCRGEGPDRYGVCPECGNVLRRLPDLEAGHKVGCNPFGQAAWHAVRLAKVGQGRARWYVRLACRRIRGGA